VRPSPFLAGCALVMLVGCPRLPAEPVVITVRVIDARNGNPYKKLALRIDFLRAEWSSRVYRIGSDPWRENLIATELQKTNDKGEVIFNLPTPLPGVIWVFSGPMACGTEYFDAKAVLERGVVGENHCNTRWAKKKVNFQAKPGEIIYFATHVGFFEGALTK